MLLIYDDAGTIRTAGIAIEPRPAVTHPEPVTETIDGVEQVTGHTTVIDTPAETEAECIARMIALVVPPGERYLTVPPTEIPDAPPERWAVDLEAGTVTALPVPPGPVPDISAAQARLWLLSIGKTDADIIALIASLPPQQSAPALILWEYATVYRRSYPLWDLLAPAIGLTSAGMDDAFRAASLL